MNFNKKLFFISLLLIFTFSIGGAFAETQDAMVELDSGIVSGDAEVISVNPWDTKGQLNYTISNDVTEVISAKVIVSTYSGSGAPTYALNSNTTLNINNDSFVLGYEQLTYPDNTKKDPNVYKINNHTTKQYSDYQMIYDIKDYVKNLTSGESFSINVESTEFENKSFDGRIKLITLFFAYNDGDSDNITYWLNVGQSWTNNTRNNTIFTNIYNKTVKNAIFENIALSSSQGQCKFNDKNLINPIKSVSKNYYLNYAWDVTDAFNPGNDCIFEYSRSKSSTWGTFKSNVQLLKIYECYVNDVKVNQTKPMYKGTCYAGVNNTITIDIVNNENKTVRNINVKLIENDKILNNFVIDEINPNSTYEVKIVDPTIRPITKNTVYGVNNSNMRYNVIIEDKYYNILNNFTTPNYTINYNGNLGKEYAYPQSNGNITRKYIISGDMIILNKDDTTYLSNAADGRNDTWNIEFDGILKEALLYVPYNWDKTENQYPEWNLTFNGNSINPIAHYRDQSNLGKYGVNGYGLFVYNVSSLIKLGNNTCDLRKISGKTAVYPSSLLVLYDSENVTTFKTIYISENADLLSTKNNKELETGSKTFYNIDDVNIDSSKIYIFAASAQENEGDLIINGETHENVWNGSSKSLNYVSYELNNVTNNNTVYFKSTGSTILALHQLLVLSWDIKSVNLTAEEISIYYRNGTRFYVSLKDTEGNPLKNESVIININGVNYTKTSNDEGIASIAINLDVGTYDVSVLYNGSEFYYPDSTNSKINVLSTIIGKDLTKFFRNESQYYAKFLDKEGNPIKNTNVTFNINGVFYNRSTNDEGIAKLNINLDPREYIITAFNPITNQNFSNNIKVLPRIIANDVTKYFRNGTQYYAKLVDSEGNPIIGKNLTFNINGIFYQRTTDNNGIAKLNINLDPREYIITAIDKDSNSKVSNKIKVLPRLFGKNINMKVRDGTFYQVKLVDEEGNALANKEIKMNINGVFYNKITDGEGVAKLKINLDPRSYIISSYYENLVTSNTIVVKK